MDKEDLKSLLKEVILEMKEEEVAKTPKKKKKVARKRKAAKKKVDPNSLPALRAKAKKAGIKGYYKMKKADLKAVLDRGKNNLPSMLEGITDLSESEQKELAKAAELDKASKPATRFGNRRAVSKIDVSCRVCQKKEQIYPSQMPFSTAEDRKDGWNSYCCNRCVGRG